jgi:FkbM family methyltransferase
MDLLTVDFSFKGKTIPFIFREGSAGDAGVMQQIFQQLDYDISHWPQGRRLAQYHAQQSVARPSLIIDAGANIGASAVYFLNLYDNAFVYAIEPEPNNFQVLELNTQAYPNKANFLGAIAQGDGELVLDDPGLSDWGFRTRPAQAGDAAGSRVKSISPRTILADARVAGMTPLIFKIDIEGGEAGLFAGDTAWMRQFALIVIELHDWMLPFAGSSKNFLKAAASHEFDLVHKGENIFLFNRDILAA